MFEQGKKKRGQSILEIAIFGSLLLLVIAALLQYGLKYGYQQRAKMRAFRRSLGASADYDRGNQGSVTYFQDRHIPGAGNPLGIGSFSPYMAAGSVTRNYMLINTPDKDSELPLAFIYVNDDANPYRFNLAGFQVHPSVSEEDYEKYCEIYGDLYVMDAVTGEVPVYPHECCEWVDEYGNPLEDDAYGNAVCIAYCPVPPQDLKIVDSCLGNLIDYYGCKKQCLMMEDTSQGREICRRHCERGKAPGDDKDCTEICNAHVDQPGYCGSLDDIFSFALANNKPPVMGVQTSDLTQRTSISDTLRKSESGGSITTTDSLDWSSTMDRSIVYIEGGSVVEEGVSTTLGESVTQRCTDGVCN